MDWNQVEGNWRQVRGTQRVDLRIITSSLQLPLLFRVGQALESGLVEAGAIFVAFPPNFLDRQLMMLTDLL